MMYSASFMFLCVFFSVYLEVLAGSLGVVIPMTALCVFCISVSRGWITGMSVGMVAGAVLDLLYGRSMLVSAFSMMAIAGLSNMWLYWGDTQSAFFHFLPGACAAMVAVLPAVTLNSLRPGSLYSSVLILTFSMLTGAFLLPMLIPLYDLAAEMVGMPLYRTARSRVSQQRR
ncbi:MAG: hypothetical protein JW808_08965 [Victivallales bacterium]|nr:hypothetical protein [Victivallales bacterium]